MGLLKTLMKSQWINNNSCTQELTSQEGLYDRKIMWHPQKGTYEKTETNVIILVFKDCGLCIDDKNSKRRNNNQSMK